MAAVILAAAPAALPQVSDSVLVEIVKAEDALRFDGTLIRYLKDRSAEVRLRAALAAGRIGDQKAVEHLSAMIGEEPVEVARIALFALGEIESPAGADPVLKVLKDPSADALTLAVAVEAAGKIGAANSSNPVSGSLGEAILDVLGAQDRKGDEQSRDVVLKGLTAALRVRPKNADLVIAKFFANKDARVRADAANAYSRIRGKTAVKELQSMLAGDEDPVVRANAARALGVTEDRTAVPLLLDAAEKDVDLRVRVNALRSVGGFEEQAVIERLIKAAKALFADFAKDGSEHPEGQNELLEAASALGRSARGSGNEGAAALLRDMSARTGYIHGEIESAIAAIAPAEYFGYLSGRPKEASEEKKAVRAAVQGTASIADFLNEEKNGAHRASALKDLAGKMALIQRRSEGDPGMLMALPGVIDLYSRLRAPDADAVLRGYLTHRDVFVRAAAASAMADRTVASENVSALIKAFRESLETDKDYNDAQLSILGALVKLDKAGSAGSLQLALGHYDYLVRKQAATLARENGLEKELKDFSGPGLVRKASAGAYSSLGQVLNTDADYRRAVARRNGSSAVVVVTEKGKFTIDLFPEQAPLTVDNFIKLARKGYFNGISIHRVVANFVVQDGDPRGDGNGGPGWQIRCEINTIPYDRGMVGMALSGKDTGGSQWFVTHSPQPHLDGGYTVFGRVDDKGMKIVDRLARGDRIRSIDIVESK